MAVTIQQIMQSGWHAYEQQHRLADFMRKAIVALITCRTAALGGHMQGCPEGHFVRHWYNSCKHRICPQCAFILIERWLLKQKARLLGCDHFHLIFTVPHQLNQLWLLNVRLMTKLLFAAVRDTVFAFLKDEKYLGAIPGIIASLHTWNQTLLLHPHIHCLVSGGGLDAEGRWCTPKRGDLLPMKAVMIKFRGKLLAYIDREIRKGNLQLPADMNYQRWLNLKNKLGRKIKWNVHIRQRYSHGEGVLIYLARYVRGGPMSNNRLLAHQNDDVSFSYRSNGKDGASNKKEIMQLDVEELIARYLLHVPLPRTKVVRYYGLYAPAKKKEMAVCREIFGQAPVEETLEALSWQDYCEKQGAEHPELCPVCGRRLVRLAEIQPIREWIARPIKRPMKSLSKVV